MQEVEGQVSLFDQDSQFGKMSPELSAPTKDKTSKQFSNPSPKLSKKMPLYLCLRKTNGQQVDASWEMGGALLGEFSMHSFGESPKEGAESHLSQILEVDAPKKYYLSATACLGILRRARRRGKELPFLLHEALIYMIFKEDKNGQTDDNNVPAVIDSTAYCIGNGQVNDAVCPDKELCKTLNCMDDPMKVLIVKEEPVICLQGNQIDQADTSVCNGSGFKEGTCYTLNVRDRHAVVYNGENITNPLNKTNPQIGDACHTITSDSRNYLVETKPHYIVRRLTPLECERLQGYPDGWTDIGEYTDSKGKKKKTSDTVRYKALGNSIALPPWKWIIKRLCSHYERDATMASLFDGIGGFPCIWEQINGKGTALWASEIEDFPIAVTKVRIE